TPCRRDTNVAVHRPMAQSMVGGGAISITVAQRFCRATFPGLTGITEMHILLWSATLVLGATAAHADPIASQDIYVLDGNTIDMQGQRIRLVGYDAPEEGQRAHCASERTLAARIAARLRQIISRGDKIDLQIVACACPPGTEGTQQCNNGWRCGRLTV